MRKQALFFKCIILFAVILGTRMLIAQFKQPPPFQDEIRHFRKMDSIAMPPPGKLLMIGSSSFTMWQDVARYMPGHPWINRGFGGSSLTDLIDNFDDVVTPYKARQVFIYCGENDIAAGASPDTVVRRFQQLFGMLRALDSTVYVTYVSMKPSLSRLHLMPRMMEGNDQIRAWLDTQRNTSFADVFTPMLDENGRPRTDIFIEDGLHLNDRGYEIWAKVIAPHVAIK